MRKIRIGNDFTFYWAIEREGLPEDFSKAIEKRLTASVFGKKIDVPFTIEGNILKIEFTPEICNVAGVYNLEFSYTLTDTALSDENRKCRLDIEAFQIVSRTSQADDPSEFAITSDMAVAIQGKSAYGVWLDDNPGSSKDDYYDWLRQPATDIAETVGLQEQARVEAEELRVLAEQDRQTNTQIAITSAEEATLNANNAATNADEAREAIQSDLGAKAFHGYASIEVAKTLKEVEELATTSVGINDQTDYREVTI